MNNNNINNKTTLTTKSITTTRLRTTTTTTFLGCDSIDFNLVYEGTGAKIWKIRKRFFCMMLIGFYDIRNTVSNIFGPELRNLPWKN